MKFVFPKVKSFVKKFSIVLVCAMSFVTHAQKTQERSIVVADSTWTKEIIPFPIEWAPKFSLDGFEELRFAPNWDDPNHSDFWSLVMSWDVTAHETIPIEELEVCLENYFDGLMKPNHWSDEFINPKALFFSTVVSGGNTVHRGKLAVFDGFHTGKPMILTILSEQLRCPNTGKVIIIFRLSPQDYTHPIWDTLNSIAVKATVCDD